MYPGQLASTEHTCHIISESVKANVAAALELYDSVRKSRPGVKSVGETVEVVDDVIGDPTYSPEDDAASKETEEEDSSAASAESSTALPPPRQRRQTAKRRRSATPKRRARPAAGAAVTAAEPTAGCEQQVKPSCQGGAGDPMGVLLEEEYHHQQLVCASIISRQAAELAVLHDKHHKSS